MWLLSSISIYRISPLKEKCLGMAKQLRVSMGHTHYYEYVPRKDYTNNFGFYNLQCKRVDGNSLQALLLDSDFVATSTAVDTHKRGVQFSRTCNGGHMGSKAATVQLVSLGSPLSHKFPVGTENVTVFLATMHFSSVIMPNRIRHTCLRTCCKK